MTKVWKNGKIIPQEAASVDITSHALHYGSSFFEGIRAYRSKNGSVIFRAKEHFLRLEQSARIYKTEIPYSQTELLEATKALLKENNMPSAYIRPLVYRGAGGLGVTPRTSPVEVAIITLDWGAYLGEDALENGISVQVSSWRRPAPDTFPSLAKAGGNYLNSQLIKMEALDNGFDEGIALDVFGNLSEGSGENLFLVYQGNLYTTPMASSSLAGITRDSIIQLAKARGINVIEQNLPREMLYIADEIFLSGTAAEITPVASVDHIAVGNGDKTISKQLQRAFFDVVEGKDETFKHWLEPYTI